MARSGAKKRLAENASWLSTLRLMIGGANAVYVLVRLVYHGMDSMSVWHWIGLVLLEACYYLGYAGLRAVAQPTFGPDGSLIDEGGDLGMSGMCEYYHDAIYISLVVQVGTAVLSDMFWWLFSVIPCYAAYKAWTLVIGPWIFSGSDQTPDSPRTAKKKAKAARKQR